MRRGGARPDMAVLHYTGMSDCAEALARLCDPSAEVSAHYLITRDGTVYRLVDEDMRAWHAGAGAWGAVTDVNSRSIGVELDNCGASPFAEPQMAALEGLLAGVMQRWRIRPERVIGHADMAPERKSDPGPRFDWRRLARRGLAVWPAPSPGPASETAPDPDPDAFVAALARFGYPAAPLPALLAAFRARFRGGVQGPLDAQDMTLAAHLAARFPVDRGARHP
ncbi:N-acetylmuramoyl-L-alanine amidase [Alkalilacustris brevis]|uniref:N-acetylmuramoyl-L-alanine amidase n=1 Tax=Alkalilacustris brevis TaxID=2026338 RepID=UPI000E0CDDFE|nr:N-acetylmuramoyl-L-alanine amidase [Alkalilacustris brevis]